MTLAGPGLIVMIAENDAADITMTAVKDAPSCSCATIFALFPSSIMRPDDGRQSLPGCHGSVAKVLSARGKGATRLPLACTNQRISTDSTAFTQTV